MEPASLKTPLDEDASLAAMMHSRAPEISDDGFSARVLAALPPPRTAPARWPWVAYLGGGIAGAVFVAVRAALTRDAASQLANALGLILVTLADPWFELGLAIAALSLLIAFAFNRPSWRPW